MDWEKTWRTKKKTSQTTNRRGRDWGNEKEREPDDETLGEKGQLTGGYMLITLWFFKQFVHTFPRGDMLITF